MSRVVLLTGSNAPDRDEVLRRTAEILARRIGSIERTSQIYDSEPWGFHAEEMFANQALVLQTTLTPIEVLDEALATECEVGRNREDEQEEKALTGERYASRVVDVDVMFYDDEIIDTPRLKVPHPLLHLREFALEPLCEIMGDYCHPVLGGTLNMIYEELKGTDPKI